MSSAIALDTIKINKKLHHFYYNVHTHGICVMYNENNQKVIETYEDFYKRLSSSEFNYVKLKEYLVYIKQLIHKRLLCKPMKTEALTEEEYTLLEKALSKNNYLNTEQKEWLKSFKPLLIGEPLNIDALYYRYATLKIKEDNLTEEVGFYQHLYNELITARGLPENWYKLTLRHEGVHLHQKYQNFSSDIYEDFFVEGITELIALEYGEYEESDYNLLYRYGQEVLICKILCELFGKERIKTTLMNFNIHKFCELLRENLTEEQIYQLLLWTSLYKVYEDDSDINLSAIIADVYYLLYDVARKKYNSHNSENLQNIREYMNESITGKRYCKKKYFINN